MPQGFVIGAHSVSGSKFKLLMFEATEEGQWELLLQEDSIKVTPPPQLSSQSLGSSLVRAAPSGWNYIPQGWNPVAIILEPQQMLL